MVLPNGKHPRRRRRLVVLPFPNDHLAEQSEQADHSGETEDQMKERRRCEAVARAILQHKSQVATGGDGASTAAPDSEELRNKISTAMKNTANEIAAEKQHDDDLRARGFEVQEKYAPKGRKPARRASSARNKDTASPDPSEAGPELHDPAQAWPNSAMFDRYPNYHDMPRMSFASHLRLDAFLTILSFSSQRVNVSCQPTRYISLSALPWTVFQCKRTNL